MKGAPLTDEFADEFLKNVYRLWLIPEVQQRLSAGTLSGDTKIWAGQVIFDLDRAPKVRLNEEVNGIFHIRPEANLPEGATVDAHNAFEIASNVVSFELDDEDSPDGAHITVLLGGRGFYIDFDLRYNSAIVAELVLRAREFLDVAKHARTMGSIRAFIVNLHVAIEALAKAHLLLHPDNEILASKKHGFLRGRYNRHSKQGGTDKRFASLLNRLDELRNPARFAFASVSLSDEEVGSLIDTSEEMFNHVLAVSPSRTHRRIAPV